MYQFSRSLYRQLAADVVPGRGEDVGLTRQHFLRACESSMERLALDRHYFAKPGEDAVQRRASLLSDDRAAARLPPLRAST